jgi:hypothetical protein
MVSFYGVIVNGACKQRRLVTLCNSPPGASQDAVDKEGAVLRVLGERPDLPSDKEDPVFRDGSVLFWYMTGAENGV